MPARPKRVSAVSYAEPSEASASASEQEDVEDGEDELESEGEGEGEGEGEEDAEGEEEDVEDQMDLDPDAEGEEEEEDAEGEDEDEDVPAPQPVKIRFKVNPSSSLSALGSSSSSSGRTPTGSGIGMGTAGPSSRLKRTGSGVVPTKGKHARIESPPAEEEDPYSDDFDEDNQDRNRSNSPSKLTARQRAKGNKDLQETLVSLPEAGTKKPVVLTEAERLQRREESARRRKRQTEQRLQDEQDQTINRLLRAQTSKSRSKLDAPQTDSPAPEPNQEGVENEEIPDQGQGQAQGGGRRVMPIKEGMVRYVSRLEGEGEGGKLVNLIGVVEGREDWIKVG